MKIYFNNPNISKTFKIHYAFLWMQETVLQQTNRVWYVHL